MQGYKPPKRFVDLGFMVLGGVTVWYLTNKLASLGEGVKQTAEVVTVPVADLISDVMAGLNGWEAVQLQPLLIRQAYLTPEYRLNTDAESVLWGVAEYRPLLTRLFGERGGVMRERYRALVGVPIERESI